MRTRALILAAATGAVLIGQTPSLAQSAATPSSEAQTADDVTALSGVDVVAPKPAPTPLSGLDVVVPRKPAPTAVSGVDVVARRGATVSELTITLPPCPAARPSDSPAPKVVSSYPENGAQIRPGIVVVRVTFDKPMTCVGLLGKDWPLTDPCPAPLRSPVISRDRRTFMTVCVVEPGRRYGLLLSNFTSLGGTPLPSQELAFQTSDMPQVATVAEALAQDSWLQKASYTAP